MKRLEKILVNIVGTMVAVYAAIVLLFSLPFMQTALASWTASLLTAQLKSKVDIGSVNLGFLNRIIVNDITVYEPNGKIMGTIARMSASIDLISLLSGQIDIGTAQLFGIKATLYRETPESAPNYQFIIDAFAKEEQEEPAKLDLHIGSFIMRHANVTYDIRSRAMHPGTLDMNHLNLHDCGMNVVLRCLTDDSINISVKRLKAKELNSGLALKDTQFKLAANSQTGSLSQFSLSLPHSHIETDLVSIEYGALKTDSIFRVFPTIIKGSLTPCDLKSISSKLAPLNQPFQFRISAEGDNKCVTIKECRIESDGLLLDAQAHTDKPLHQQQLAFHGTINQLHGTSDAILNILTALVPKHGQEELIGQMKDVNFAGTIDYAANGITTSKGKLETGLGSAEYDMELDNEQFLTAELHADSLSIDQLLQKPQWGKASFDLDVAINLSQTKPFPAGSLQGNIRQLQYNGYNYKDIALDAHSTSNSVKGTLSINDMHIKANADFAYANAASKDIQLALLLEQFHPHDLHLTPDYRDENLSMNMAMNLKGRDFNHLYGTIAAQKIQLSTPDEIFRLDELQIQAEPMQGNESLYTITSDIISGYIQGETTLADIVNNCSNQLAHHLPLLFKHTKTEKSHFTYNLTLTDAPILHHFTDQDFNINVPIQLSGDMNSDTNEMQMTLNAPSITYNQQKYDNMAMVVRSTADNMNMHAITSYFQEGDDDNKPTTTTIDITADVHNNRIVSDLYLNAAGQNNIALQLLPIVQLSDSLGNLKTNIQLRKSYATINDTTWTMSPAHLAFYQKDIECHNLRFANNNTNSYLAIDGKASTSPTDSLVATLNNLEVKYLLSIIKWNVVRFAGRASGRAVMSNVMAGGMPNIRADLSVADLSIQEGPLGDANISAHWDKDVDGISVTGRIIDLYKVPDALTGRERNVTGITTLDGWISPAKNDICLNVNTHNTNAAFLHGFLRGVFKEINGYVTGPISIIGPLNNVNIVGDAVPNINLRLRATNVPYHIEGDTLRLRPYLFDFQNISLYDRFGHRSTISGQLTHRNMKNFAYHFKGDLHELLAYDEKEFNSDKFKATVFVDGDLNIDGSDGHPLYVNAHITPTRGSSFAYDAATPDAITGNSFIEFRDRDSLLTQNPDIYNLTMDESNDTAEKDSLTILKEAKKNYDSDIFLNFDINLTPDCEVRLRMDNIEDGGYMRTFGNAALTAKWYNKGSFQLFGNYNIQSGSYRLYLQDIIFRDLALQPNSMVEFNGNPFDANIHLICHHTINSVPLSDLTATRAFSQNNKVKVICLLDITGKLGNMDFKFDIDLPNVNDETRQLVRSMINSEEEMNTQAIYLLGLGRFYPNEFARANNGGGNSGQAANSLLSSTLSGQINQMLSNVIGHDSNWNFGSSLTTGEKGWNDLDVEGLLEGRLFDERLLINGAFGYRDNAMTNNTSFIGDFEVKWRMDKKGNLYVKAYNQTNDRYFTKATLNTQGIGLSWRHSFENIRRKWKIRTKKRTTH